MFRKNKKHYWAMVQCAPLGRVKEIIYDFRSLPKMIKRSLSYSRKNPDVEIMIYQVGDRVPFVELEKIINGKETIINAGQ